MLQTALYQQKLKLGIYTTPIKSVGVQLNALDTAALLAALADLTVRPAYERTVAQEAHHAATLARAPAVRDPRADEQLRTGTIKTTGTGIPSFNHSGIYTRAAKQLTGTMTLRIYPEHNQQRGGIATSQLARRAADALGDAAVLDITKINEVAGLNSLKLLNSRFNPDLDYRSGLAAHQPAQFLNNKEESLAAKGAAASLKEGYTHSVAQQKRANTFSAQDAINPNLLAAANRQAAERLKLISLQGSPQDFRNQAQLYANALALAQKRSHERLEKHARGDIDLGLGATITEAELNAMAQRIVGPVLQDIDAKAASQRKHAEALRAEREHLTHQHKLAKEEEKARKAKEKAELEAAHKKRLANHALMKQEAEKAHQELLTKLDGEVEAATRDLRATEQKHAKNKEALDKKKVDVGKELDEKEAAKRAEREQELKDLQAEKDEEIKPLHTELEEHNAKLTQVTDAHKEVENDHNQARDTNAELLEQIKALEQRLVEQQDEVVKYTEDLATAKRERAETTEDIEVLEKRLDDQLASARTEAHELDDEIDDLKRQQKSQEQAKQANRQKVQAHVDERVRDERKIHETLPEHLRGEPDEAKWKDTSSLFTVEEPEPVKEEPVKAAATEAKSAVTTDAKDATTEAKSAVATDAKDATTEAKNATTEAKDSAASAAKDATAATEKKATTTTPLSPTKQKVKSLIPDDIEIKPAKPAAKTEAKAEAKTEAKPKTEAKSAAKATPTTPKKDTAAKSLDKTGANQREQNRQNLKSLFNSTSGTKEKKSRNPFAGFFSSPSGQKPSSPTKPAAKTTTTKATTAKPATTTKAPEPKKTETKTAAATATADKAKADTADKVKADTTAKAKADTTAKTEAKAAEPKKEVKVDTTTKPTETKADAKKEASVADTKVDSKTDEVADKVADKVDSKVDSSSKPLDAIAADTKTDATKAADTAKADATAVDKSAKPVDAVDSKVDNKPADASADAKPFTAKPLDAIDNKPPAPKVSDAKVADDKPLDASHLKSKPIDALDEDYPLYTNPADSNAGKTGVAGAKDVDASTSADAAKPSTTSSDEAKKPLQREPSDLSDEFSLSTPKIEEQGVFREEI